MRILRSRLYRMLGVWLAFLVGLPAFATTWTSTATHGFPLGSTIAASPVSPDMRLHVVVVLKLQNSDDLAALIARQAEYGGALSSSDFVARYAPTVAQVQEVTAYLASQGFTGIHTSEDRLLVQADGSAQAIQSAFNTRLVTFPVAGVTGYAPVQDVQVPETLQGVVLSVAGLENLSAVSRRHASASGQQLDVRAADDIAQVLQLPSAGTPDPTVSTFSPGAIRKAYDEGATASGAATVVATVTEGDDLSQVIADLRQAESTFGLPMVPVSVRQVVPVPSPPDNSGDTEWDLDSQWITGIAYNVKQLVFYNTASLSDADLLVANDAFAQDDIAKVGNMSYGGCENLEAILGGLPAFDQLFERAVAQGQTWSASSGDAGAACSVLINLATPDLGVPSSVEYPASSPWVVAVGGTTLITDSSYNYSTELAWDAGGGGTSLFEGAPAWQAADGAIPTAAAGLRAVPDIAMVAGPEGAAGVGVGGAAAVIIDGAEAGVLGTSWSSPLNVGVWARFQSGRCNALGFEAPAIYTLDANQSPGSTATGLHDVLLGTNGEYTATPGWDFTTGYGSFDIDATDHALPAAESGCVPPGQVASPVAALNVSPAIGVAPSAVAFDASGSYDPQGELASYALQYGEGAVVVQDTAALPSHTYQEPGTYTAVLRVRNASGGLSAPVQTPVTVLGTPPGCSTGGDPAVVASPGVSFGVEGTDIASGADDLLGTTISEPGDNPGMLVFTMKVANLDTIPSGFRWVTYFDVAGRDEPMQHYYYVAMVTSDGPTPVFNYGIHGLTPGGASDYTVLGTLDAASGEYPDGTIVLTLEKSALGIVDGDRLTNILSATRTSAADGETVSAGGLLDTTVNAPGGEGLTQDEAGARRPYAVVGNATCAAGAEPVAHLLASTSRGRTRLEADFDGGESSAQPGLATVSYFRFAFGDGTSTPWQTESTVSHVYDAAGNYVASLEVADSRGLVSQTKSLMTVSVGH